MDDPITYICEECQEEYTEAQYEGLTDDRCEICGGPLEWY
jgi:rRNA maturation endonuclease Nob1